MNKNVNSWTPATNKAQVLTLSQQSPFFTVGDARPKMDPGFVGPEVHTIWGALFKKGSNNTQLKIK